MTAVDVFHRYCTYGPRMFKMRCDGQHLGYDCFLYRYTMLERIECLVLKYLQIDEISCFFFKYLVNP